MFRNIEAEARKLMGVKTPVVKTARAREMSAVNKFRIVLSSQSPKEMLMEALNMGFDPINKQQTNFQAKTSGSKDGLKWNRGSCWRMVQEGDKKVLILDEDLVRENYGQPVQRAASLRRRGEYESSEQKPGWGEPGSGYEKKRKREIEEEEMEKDPEMKHKPVYQSLRRRGGLKRKAEGIVGGIEYTNAIKQLAEALFDQMTVLDANNVAKFVGRVWSDDMVNDLVRAIEDIANAE